MFALDQISTAHGSTSSRLPLVHAVIPCTTPLLHGFEMDEFEEVDESEQAERYESVEGTKGIVLFFPQVEESKKPHLQTTFDTIDEAEEFYKEYAKVSGFATRKSTLKYWPKTREMYSREFVCTKQGGKDAAKEVTEEVMLTNQDKGKQKRNRSTSRTLCQARMKVQKARNSTTWRVKKFDEAHNHICHSPSKVHLLPQNREIGDAQKCLLNTFNAANVPTSQSFNIIRLQSGGVEHVGFIEKDVRNWEAKMKRERKDYDAQLLLEWFQNQNELNPSFYYAIDMDDDSKLRHCFWADGYARKSYAHFNDIVVFDTTYDTNQYHMIFAPFTGINHHNQSVCFGWALLKDEKIESFVWLFNQFLDAMSGQAPRVIITDQDPAMKNAISQIFPETFHRLCMWHILQKLPDKIRQLGTDRRPLGTDRDFCDCLLGCAYGSETPEEFEEKWGKFISQYKLEAHKWLLDMYNIRDRWIPAHFKDIFMAGMRTTQRSESLNAFFDRYVSKKNTLVDFLVRFKQAIERQRDNEFRVNFRNVDSMPQTKRGWAVEIQMRDIYTNAIFRLFQGELMLCTKYGASRCRNSSGDLDTYTVVNVDEATSSTPRKVVHDLTWKTFICECKMFEHEGIPCRHILATMRSAIVKELPHQLILKRWTKNATKDIVYDASGVELRPDARDPERHIRRDELSTKYASFMQKASTSKETLELAQLRFDEFTKSFYSECQELGLDLSGNNNVGINAVMPTEIHIHPPVLSKTKGSGKRLKGWKDKLAQESKKPKRQCKGCGQFVHHDKRNCPKLKAQGTTSSTGLVDEDDSEFDDEQSNEEEDEISLSGPSLGGNL